ncbi:MAG: type 4a pilus biogenesis protein PilO [Gemmatimonadota bacterium]
MALLPQERHKQISLLVGFLALAAIYGYFEYVYSPEANQVAELEVRLDRLEDNNRRAQIIAARGGAELEERLAVYERHVRRLEELIPQSEEVPALLNSITTAARQSRVELESFGPEPTSPGQFYNRQTYEMAATGGYHDVARFLTSIASLPRIVTPTDVDVSPFGGPSGSGAEYPVVARFRIETYILPDGDGMPDPSAVDDVEANP